MGLRLTLSLNGIMTNINVELFEQLRVLMGEKFKLLIDTYISDNSSRIDQLQVAIKGENWSEVRELSHAMKSSSANIGATELSLFCQQIESDSVNNVDEIKLKYDRLRNEFQAVVSCLNNNR